MKRVGFSSTFLTHLRSMTRSRPCASDGAGVTVNLATGGATDGTGANDTLTLIENVTGSGFNDTITGDTGANILHHRQHLTRYAANQAKALWERYPIGEAADVHIGVLGLGSIGVRIAETLVGFEFKVSGWARGPHQIAGVDCHYGPDALAPLLANLDYVVCVLQCRALRRDEGRCHLH